VWPSRSTCDCRDSIKSAVCSTRWRISSSVEVGITPNSFISLRTDSTIRAPRACLLMAYIAFLCSEMGFPFIARETSDYASRARGGMGEGRAPRVSLASARSAPERQEESRRTVRANDSSQAVLLLAIRALVVVRDSVVVISRLVLMACLLRVLLLLRSSAYDYSALVD